MINVTTKTIKQLSFSLLNNTAIFILSDYLESNSQKSSIEQHIAPLTKLMLFIHEQKNNEFSESNINEYVDSLFAKTYSTAYSSRVCIRQFLRFLSRNGYCKEIYLKPVSQYEQKCEQNENKPKRTNKYYDVFGITNLANEKEIKKAFHRLALKYHPDMNQSPDSSQQFLSISRIYNVLIDENLRLEYDITMGYVSGTSDRKKSDYYVVF